MNLPMDDYPYDWVDFEGDPNIFLPLGEEFDERGKNVMNFHVF